MDVLDPAADSTLTAPAVAGMTTATSVIAHKFGGSSLADASRIRWVADLLKARTETTQVVVVSAMQGVTDALLALADSAARPESDWRERWAALRSRHLDACRELLGEYSDSQEWLRQQFTELEDLLHAVSVLGIPGREVLERIQGLGEVYSSRLLADLMRQQGSDVARLDARDENRARHRAYRHSGPAP